MSALSPSSRSYSSFFFFNDTAPTEIYTLSLHDALPILSLPPDRHTITLSPSSIMPKSAIARPTWWRRRLASLLRSEEHTSELSHVRISYAVFCLKKKKKTKPDNDRSKKSIDSRRHNVSV